MVKGTVQIWLIQNFEVNHILVYVVQLEVITESLLGERPEVCCQTAREEMAGSAGLRNLGRSECWRGDEDGEEITSSFQRLERRRHKTASFQGLLKEETFSSFRSVGLLKASWTLDLENCQKISLYCLKPLKLWQFFTAIIRTQLQYKTNMI